MGLITAEARKDESGIGHIRRGNVKTVRRNVWKSSMAAASVAARDVYQARLDLLYKDPSEILSVKETFEPKFWCKCPNACFKS